MNAAAGKRISCESSEPTTAVKRQVEDHRLDVLDGALAFDRLVDHVAPTSGSTISANGDRRDAVHQPRSRRAVRATSGLRTLRVVRSHDPDRIDAGDQHVADQQLGGNAAQREADVEIERGQADRAQHLADHPRIAQAQERKRNPNARSAKAATPRTNRYMNVGNRIPPAIVPERSGKNDRAHLPVERVTSAGASSAVAGARGPARSAMLPSSARRTRRRSGSQSRTG